MAILKGGITCATLKLRIFLYHLLLSPVYHAQKIYLGLTSPSILTYWSTNFSINWQKENTQDVKVETQRNVLGILFWACLLSLWPHYHTVPTLWPVSFAMAVGQTQRIGDLNCQRNMSKGLLFQKPQARVLSLSFSLSN